MTPQEQLELSIILSTEKHAGQTDRSGKPYILHPLRVMGKVKSLPEKTVAMLHDVIEDTDVTAADLLDMGFSPCVVEAVVSVTRNEGESRLSAAQRSANNRMGCAVKLADLADNMDLTRLDHISEKDASRYQEYCAAKELLEQAKAEKWGNFDEISLMLAPA